MVFVREENRHRIEERFIRSAPDLVAEVSSPATPHGELVRKRSLYERFEVPEHWLVDLESGRVEGHRLEGRRYGKPLLLGRGEVLESPRLPEFRLEVEDLLGPSV